MAGADVYRDLPDIETDRLLLRRMRLDDAEAMFDYASDPDVTRYVIWDTHRSIEDSRAFLKLTVESYAGGNEAGWGIVYKGDLRFVGTCAIVNWSRQDARAELGYVLSKRYWGRGLMTEAVGAMIRFGFGKMGLNRLEARCLAENVASARVMEKAGMTCEGTLRQREHIKGEYRDMKYYSILRGEFRGSRGR